MLRECLESSGLFLEGTETFTSQLPLNSYYGYNVSKSDREPIDQIHGHIAAKRIQERNANFGDGGRFYAFVAGIFEVLNATSTNELRDIVDSNGPKERRKRELFESVFRQYSLFGSVMLTSDVWGDEAYWEILAKMLDSPKFSYGSLRVDTMKWYSSEDQLDKVLPLAEVASGLMNLPKKLLNRIGKWPAALIYTPVEIAEAKYFETTMSVKCKIGHMDETVYDKHILPFMDVIHLRQPTDFMSRRTKPRGVTPYIHKERLRDPKIRVFFDDTVSTIGERLASIEVEEYLYSIIPGGGEVLNPFVDKAILAVESARAQGRIPVNVRGVEVSCGTALIQAIYDGSISVKQLAADLPNMIYSNLVQPFLV